MTSSRLLEHVVGDLFSLGREKSAGSWTARTVADAGWFFLPCVCRSSLCSKVKIFLKGSGSSFEHNVSWLD